MSYTLTQSGVDIAKSSNPCATCDNAIWQSYSAEEQEDIEEYHGRDISVKDAKLSCWCMILHRYILTQRKYCDGNAPEELGENII